MWFPTVAIINFSRRSDQEVQDAIRAINRQIREDFMPVWGSGRSLKMRPSSFNPSEPDTLAKDPVEAGGVIYLVDDGSVEGALGYHDMNAREIPVGFIFVLGDDWTVTLSHEVLEMILDPTVNIFIPGPDPRFLDDDGRWLLHSYDACDAATARGADILLIDTAGRLHTQDHLMRELGKIQRVVERKIPGAPHEVLLVLDATVGQNAVQQARQFAEHVSLTGIFLAKLDGSAKGGIVVGIRDQLNVPVKFVGLGETPADIEPFDPATFVEAMFSDLV